MKENVLVHGVCSLIGDFLGISPGLIELSKTYNVFIDSSVKIDGLVELLPNNIRRLQHDAVINKHIHVNMMAAFAKANSSNWYMTQAFMEELGFPLPSIPPKANLIFDYIPTKSYDFLLSPFARSLVPEDKWQREKWQELINRLPDKKFALLGDSTQDDKNYVSGENVDIVFDLPFNKLCNLFKNCGVLISVITGTSHLAFHLGVKNILLSGQDGAWGRNPDAYRIQKQVISIPVNDVMSFLFFAPPFYEFDEEYYLSQHKDVAESIKNTNHPKNGLAHFWLHGFSEGRTYRWIPTKPEQSS